MNFPGAPSDHPDVRSGRIGVLLVNLGSPDAPEAGAVRRYLAEFLSDRRVVELPAWIWQPILRGIVLTIRPRRSAEAYAKVWTDRGSPLAVITADQAKALQERLSETALVDHAMRYGRPAIGERLLAMQAAGCDRILVAPLYPQYSAATTATVVDAVARQLGAMRWQPALRTLPAYYDDPLYIAALAQSVERALAGLDFVPEQIVASFHGMPERTLIAGDPYHCQCRKTARLLEAALGRPILTCFQSRFGKGKWLEPATDATFARLGESGVRSIAVVAPGFSADCLETREELDIRGREQFQAAGGERFAYIPCLNAETDGMAMLEGLVRRELAGWIA